MRYLNCFFLGFFGLISLDSSALTTPVDSIGTEWKNGKTLIVYKVTSGQTLYSLLKKYNVTLDEFKAVNPDFSGNLRSQETVYIPRNWKRREEPTAVTSTSGKTHKVEPGQTLFSIARKYDVGTADLKRWNNLPSDGTVKLDQVLYVSEPTKTEVAPATKPEVRKPEEPRKPEPTKDKPEVAKAPVVVTKPEVREEPRKPEEPKKEEPKKPDSTKAKPEATPTKPVTVPKPEAEVLTPVRTENEPVPNAGTGAKKVVEMGLCELIDAQDKTGKYLALHRSAPVGTMLTVRNEANNQSVIVKVIGKLPDTGLADRVVVRLSARAFEKLMPTDRRIRAEVSYLAVQ
ncbi:LysM peptidoglycan-binding domain-containing protein [Siphonobacter curvatus]|nr:LysM peptidoglycan-binding domain-containing protein [Siphonobacter curvatus]